MQSYTNPFALGWENPGNDQSSSRNNDDDPQPQRPLYGALPYSIPQAKQTVNFYITSFKPTILNSIIIGPDQRPIMYVVTDPQMPGYTIFRNVRGQSVALIEWQTHPLVEVRGVFSKRRVKDWMKLSADKS
jgi:hypothetical protein